MRIVGGLIGCMIAFVMFPMVLDGADDIKSDDQTDTFASCSTGVGETTYDVVLTKDLLDDVVTNVTSITSTLSGTDSPTAQTYVASTDTLTVAGLAASGTRTLTVNYEADALSGYTGLDSMVNFGPLIIFMGIIVASVASLWSGVQSYRSG